LKIDIKDLLSSVEPSAHRKRGWLSGRSALMDIADPQRLSTRLGNALCAFRDLRGRADYLVSAEVNTYHRAVWVRFRPARPCEDRNGKLSDARTVIPSAPRTVGNSRGELHYWGGITTSTCRSRSWVPSGGVPGGKAPALDKRYAYY